MSATFNNEAAARAINAAIMDRDPVALRRLCAVAGAPLNSAARFEHLPLHQAVIMDFIEGIEILLAAGADIEARDQSFTALQMAVMFDRKPCAITLLNKGANINVRFADTLGRMTLLHRAAQNGSGTMVRLLMERGLDPHACDLTNTSVFQYHPCVKDVADALRRERHNAAQSKHRVSRLPRP